MTLHQRRWLFDWLAREAKLMAPAESADDKKFQLLEKAGAVTCYDSMFGNRYYSMTPNGKKAIRP